MSAPAVPGNGTEATISDSAGSDALLVSGVAAPPAPTEAEVVPHTGMLNRIDPMLYTQFIAKGIATWSTAQLAGTLLWSTPIHPVYSNSIIERVTSVYNTWAGGFQYKFKVAGTGFHAGALAIVRFPPNIKPSDIQTVEDFSVFEYEIIDPKTLECQTRQLMDQRPILYHYRDFDPDVPNTFGGYFCLYVLMPLNTSSTGINQINIQIFVRAAPDFCVSQLRPITIANTTPTDTLAALNRALQLPPLHNMLQFPVSTIQVNAVNVPPRPTVGRAGLVDFKGESRFPSAPFIPHLLQSWEPTNEAYFDDNTNLLVVKTTGECFQYVDTTGTLKEFSPFISVRDALFIERPSSQGGARTVFSVAMGGFSFVSGTLENSSTAVISGAGNANLLEFVPIDSGVTVLDPNPDVIDTIPLSESLVYFLSNSTGSLNLFFVCLSIYKRETLISTDPRTCVLLEIYDRETNLPVSYLKLHNAGFFTAPASSTIIQYPLYLYGIRAISFSLNTDPFPLTRQIALNNLLTKVKHGLLDLPRPGPSNQFNVDQKKSETKAKKKVLTKSDSSSSE